MRHRRKGRKFNRTSAHRKAMVRNMAISVIRYGTIRTTLPKAKELRSFVEPLITLAKVDNLAKRRRAFSLLGNKEAVGKLFSTTAQVCMDRPGGYLSILKAGIRAGDNSPLALIRLMGAPDDYADQGNRPDKAKLQNKESKNISSKEVKSTKVTAKSPPPVADKAAADPATDEDKNTEQSPAK
ncbi:MAG: 50S ribosomal protein L17 [Candidatus Portiera sp.]|nr:50S ribosomal protein L17 [Portiera sp.]